MTEIDVTNSHIRVTHTPRLEKDGQPWHCALIAGNQEKTWFTETYADRDGAKDAIAWLGRFFSPEHRATIYWPADGEDGYLEIWLDNNELGWKVTLPIRLVQQTNEAS